MAIEEKWLLRKSSGTEQRISIGSSLVGEKHQNIQWKDLNSTSSSSSFTDRCFVQRLGGSLGRNENWRDMDPVGEDAHKRTGTSCIKPSPGNLFESTRDKATAYSDGQYSSPLHIQMDNIVALTHFLKIWGGGTKNLRMICLSKQI